MFYNSYKLYENLSIADLLFDNYKSLTKNKLTTEVFYHASAIEAWGHGIKLIISEAENNNLPAPIFCVYAGGIEMIFNKKTEVNLNNVPDNRLKIIIKYYCKKLQSN